MYNDGLIRWYLFCRWREQREKENIRDGGGNKRIRFFIDEGKQGEEGPPTQNFTTTTTNVRSTEPTAVIASLEFLVRACVSQYLQYGVLRTTYQRP